MITSKANPKAKQIRALRLKKERLESGLFLAEGIAHVAAALDAHASIEYICYAPDLLQSQFARALIERESAGGLPCFAMAAEVFEAVAEKDNPAGIIAVARQPRRTLAHLLPTEFQWGVALSSPQDPGNVGAILRTLDAVGAHGLILLDNAVDVYHPGAVRASMGAIFRLPTANATTAQFGQWAIAHGYHILGASAHAETDYLAAQYRRPLILLLGSEREGLTAEQVALCHQQVRLPMHGKVSSLNLSVAAGVLLYAALRQLG